ncbi:MAG: peptidoglycan editing factor PgeF [Balneolales bacterium]
MDKNISVIKPALWEHAPQIKAGFSTKIAPDKENTFDFSLSFSGTGDDVVVEQNRRQWLKYLGLKNYPIAMGNQVHGNEVRIITNSDFQDNTDGLVTTQKKLALGILVADCAAVLLADRENNVIAAVHAGWRGAIQGILEKAISKMEIAGADANYIEAFVSPCISLANFEVGTEVAEKFPEQFVDYTSFAKPHIDLKNFIKHVLLKAGLQENNLEINTLCTVAEPDILHSFRRESTRSGRMMAVIAMD